MIDINNESPTEKGRASELGLPTPKGASVAKVGAKIRHFSETAKLFLGKMQFLAIFYRIPLCFRSFVLSLHT